MFTKKSHADVKKSTLKIQDAKKDSSTRLRHLKTILEHVDLEEAKALFETNYSHVYYILYDTFIQAEQNLRQRVQKAHKEELEGSLWLLGKVLCLLPELVAKRWQCHSLSRIMNKLLHQGNSSKLRREGVKYFLLWYQALGRNAPSQVHAMFAELVPGLSVPQQRVGGINLDTTTEFSAGDFNNHPNMKLEMGASVFHDSSVHPVKSPDIMPLLPPSSHERSVPPEPKDGVEMLLDCMVQATGCIKWRDNTPQRHMACFSFLLNRFREIYLPVFCPDFDYFTSVYEPKLELPEMRTVGRREELMSSCVVSLINWVSKFTHERIINRPESFNFDDEIRENASLLWNLRHMGYSQGQLVRDVLYSTRDMINFVHEVYRQAFLLGFTAKSQIDAMKVTISVYRDWMSSSNTPPPPFILEPDPDISNNGVGGLDSNTSTRNQRLRTDSYIGAITKENLAVRAGLQNVLQVFVTHAAHVFMVQTGHLNIVFPTKDLVSAAATHVTTPLDEQTDICKRVLNIYRTMVMNTRMEAQTWEQLLLVLLQVTRLLLEQKQSQPKKNYLGGRLAQPLFQTLIVTWIRAHTNVPVNIILWEKFLGVLSSLTYREELIVEWDKTMQTLTRVLARQVYNLNLQDLPLDRLAESKGKRRRGVVSGWQHSEQPSSGSTDGNSLSTPTGQVKPSLEQPKHPQHAMLMMMSRNVPGTPGTLNRSYSEGSLAATPSTTTAVARRNNHTHHHHNQCKKNQRLKNHQIALLSDPTHVSHNASLSLSTENLNISRISTGSQHFQALKATPKMRRAMSLDSVQPANNCESGRASRSPSPSASSGMEGGSIKDSPMQIDVLSAGDTSSIDTQEDGPISNDRRSILAGGAARGWLPDVAAIMWKRMLGCLGDVNQVTNPKLHAQIFKYLVDITNSLIKIRMNQGVLPADGPAAANNNPLSNLTLVPPIGIMAPWCYGALNLPNNYLEGKLSALQLLCIIAKNGPTMGQDQLPLFYQAMHQALTSEDRAMAYTVLKHLSGARFLSLLMPGQSLLLLDLVNASSTVVTSTDTNPQTPRCEVAGLLGSLLCFPRSSIPNTVLRPSGPHAEVIEYPDLQDHVLNIVMRCARLEPTARARCVAISALSQWICLNISASSRVQSKGNGSQNQRTKSSSSISGKGEPPNTSARITEAFQIILQALQFKHRTIARIASESLKLCAEKGRYIARIDRLPQIIINSLCTALEIQNVRNPKEADKIVLTTLILCLGEFCMQIPTSILRQSLPDSAQPTTLILNVLKILHQLATGSQSDRIKLFTADEHFDMAIALDDIREQIQSDPGYQTAETTQNCLNAIRLCARTVAMHLVTNLGHFPMGGASRLSSLVEEHDDLNLLSVQHHQMSGNQQRDSLDLGVPQVLTAPNLQMFMLSPVLVASFVELSALKLPGGGITAGLVTADRQVRILLRDINGKSCWDASILYREPISSTAKDHSSQQQQQHRPEFRPMIPAHFSASKLNRSLMMVGAGASLDPLTSHVGIPMPPLRHTLRHRPAGQLPLAKDIAPDLDQLDDLLQYIGYTSPECLEASGTPLNATGPSPLSPNVEGQIISTILNQKSLETEFLMRQSCLPAPSHHQQSNVNYFQTNATHAGMAMSNVSSGFDSFTGGGAGGSDEEFRSSGSGKGTSLSLHNDLQPFHYCRLFFSQLGLASSAEKRRKTNLLQRTDKLLRELRNLDTQKCRETHKMAVIYVGAGQEDKSTILKNTCGSSTYEMFVSALGWEVELETHNGFLGGLPRIGCGSTAPYYATPFLEVIYHVATRMPSDSPEAILNKTRHLGNDEVHIVWSEHNRDYRRDILPTEFCDALITVYPLRSGLFRVTINRKPEVPWFGPLWDECVVGGRCLASLVRMTAINASRAKRTSLPFYQQFYEERNRSLEIVSSRHKESNTYEEFMSRVYSPIASNNGSVLGSGSTTGSSFSGVGGSTGAGGGGATGQCAPLVAALIDHQQHQRGSTSGLGKLRERELTQHTITISTATTAADHPSPRPGRKLPHPFKGTVKKSSSSGQANYGLGFTGSSASGAGRSTPPESPTMPVSGMRKFK